MTTTAVDLSTTYLGLHLKNPLVASASPLSKNIDTVRRLEEAGAAAIVMYSVFEEQVEYESHQLHHHLTRGAESYAEALNYFPDLNFYNMGIEAYLKHLQRVKQTVSIPVIASLNGTSPGGWVEYAQRIEEAGVDALELNLYDIPGDPEVSGGEIEEQLVTLVAQVRERVRLPLALKLSPFYSSLPHIARRFAQAGADALVLFNRFYQPDINLETLEVVPDLKLSTSNELRVRLRWIAMLYGRIPVDFGLTGGVHTAQDVLKSVMVGANVAMLASALLSKGIGHLSRILEDLQAWMVEHEYVSISEMRGSMSQRAVADPQAFERANYMKALTSLDYRLP